MNLWNWSIVPVTERTELDYSDLVTNTQGLNSIENCLEELVEVNGQMVPRKFTIRLSFENQQTISMQQIVDILRLQEEQIVAVVCSFKRKPGGPIFHCDIAIMDHEFGNSVFYCRTLK